MKIFINGEQISKQWISDYTISNPVDCYSDNPDWEENVLKLLHNWYWKTGYSYGYRGDNFLNLSTSGTTGFPQQIGHSRETIEQVIDSNIKILNLDKNSKILSYYSPRGIAFSVLSVYLALRLDCELYIETFKGINYVNRIHEIRPTHTLLLPNIWKILHKHNDWKNLDYSSVDRLITGSDFTPSGMLDELREHGPNKVYNVYGSTEVPPIVLYSEEENTYTKDSIAPGIELNIVNNQICCKWSSQPNIWISGDCVIGDIDRFTLNGRLPNMFKQDTVRVYPEQIEKAAVAAGAELALCQQVKNQCVLHYTGDITNINNFIKQFNHIPRFRLRSVNEIAVDDNLKKIIRTQIL
jgi:acyl-CoA synthetase (AMP-forming)/AMP-acid ligase II